LHDAIGILVQERELVGGITHGGDSSVSIGSPVPFGAQDNVVPWGAQDNVDTIAADAGNTGYHGRVFRALINRRIPLVRCKPGETGVNQKLCVVVMPVSGSKSMMPVTQPMVFRGQ
jgi:hypothetical protein